MDRREFVHITALGSAAGIVSFTGLGVLWEDDSDPVVTGDALSAERDTPTARTTATRTSSDTPTDPPTASETNTRTRRETATARETETATDSPTATETRTATTNETETASTTSTTAETPTATPHPSRGVESEFQPLDDYREVYVRLENTNGYAVEATATVTWRFEDGSTVRQAQTVEMKADGYWADEFRHSEEDRTFDSWGHELKVSRL